MKVINTEKLPIKLWLDDIEDGALEQAKNLANLPFVFKHIAIMPDSHQGYGMPIGGVLATKDVVIANAVGMDIGCGMSAVKTTYNNEINTEMLKKIIGIIRESIPCGVGGKLKEPCDKSKMPTVVYTDFLASHYEDARHQLGTLGSGNHFIEIQKDPNNYLWIMIHSGSRNLGKKICDHYNKLAEEICTRWYAPFPKELAWLPMDSQEGNDYWKDMIFATEFAFKNRSTMIYKCMEIMKNVMDKYYSKKVGFENIINIHHNYASIENHFGKNVIIHRKGATLAREGLLGIIPGSQGSKSYIVKGKGNKDSFESCSHGAGRKMSRSKAKDTLNLEEEIKKMDALGVIHGMRNKDDLDEAASAYKDINTVMKNQEDLVEIITELTPLAVIKG